MPDTAVVIVNWNGWRDTIRAVQSCLAQTAANRVIVCDNASADGSLGHIERWARGHADAEIDPYNPLPVTYALRPASVAVLDRAEAEAGAQPEAQLVLVRGGGNLGFAGGCNVGLRRALALGCDYGWLLNNDAMAAPDALAALLARFAAEPELGLCGSTLVEYFQPLMVQAYAGACSPANFRGRHLGQGEPVNRRCPQEQLPLRRGEIFYPVGASIIASRAFLERVGLMDETYFLYYEELDWVLRARGHFAVGLAGDSLVYHKGGASAGSVAAAPSARSIGFLYRSRLRIGGKLGKGRLPVVLGILNEVTRHLAKGKTQRTIAAFNALTGRVRTPR